MSLATRRGALILAFLTCIPVVIVGILLGAEYVRLSRCAICGKTAADVVEEELHWGSSIFGLCEEHLEALNKTIMERDTTWCRGSLREWIREMQNGPALPADALEPSNSR